MIKKISLKVSLSNFSPISRDVSRRKTEISILKVNAPICANLRYLKIQKFVVKLFFL